MVGLRNRIIHGYFTVDLESLWEIVRRDIPLLKTKLVTLFWEALGITEDQGTDPAAEAA